jgi:ADP-ribosylglycohydrolase
MTTSTSSFDREDLFRRAYGCLAGVAFGDAMGMPTSLFTQKQVKETFPDGVNDFLPAPPGHLIHNGMPAGSITDDTQQTILIAEYLLADGVANAENLAWSLIHWAEKVGGFDTQYLGPSTRRALEFIRNGGSIEDSGWMGDTNGAAMRISPVGIIHPGDLDAAVRDAAEVCKPTHNTSVAISGASAIACAIAAGMTGASTEEVIDAFLYGVEKGSRHGNPWASASIKRRTEWALDLAKSSRDESSFWTDLYDLIGAGVAMTETAPVTIALISYYDCNPLEVVRAAANMGGDADTIGAIAGSIAGTMKGIEAFPRPMLDKIEEVNNLGLAILADRLTDKALQQVEN